MKSRYFDGPKPRIFAHRGDSKNHPDNTLVAFQSAAHHTQYFELDVWLSKDGQVIVHHDKTLERICNHKAEVSELTLADLKQLDAGPGTTLATLEEVCLEFPHHFLNIEMKHPDAQRAVQLVELITRLKVEDRVLLATENDEVMKSLRQVASPEIPTSMCVADGMEFLTWLEDGCKQEYKPLALAMQVPIEYRSIHFDKPEVIQAAHHAGLEIHFWTINQEDEMRRLLKLGADAIITDDPELGASVVKEFLGRAG